jgi:hypothetical protein
VQQSRDRAGKEMIQYLGKPQLFRHNPSFTLLAFGY